MSRFVESPEPRQILEAFFHHTQLMIACLDHDLRFVAVNQAYAAADGRNPDEFIGRRHFELYPNAENERIFRRVVETGEAHYAAAKPFEYAHNPERGVTHWDWSLVPLKNAAGQVSGAVLSLLNVTARIEAIEELHASDDALRTFIDSLSDAAALVDEKGRVLFVNRVARATLARLPEAVPEANYYELLPGGAGARLQGLVEAAVVDEQPVEQVMVEEGRFFETRAFPVRRDERVVVAVLSRDVTAQHRARSELEQSLREQDVMLREIHHRVKNNLQIVSSLLYLQGKQVNDPAGRAAFETARNRIHAMGLVHERLYGSTSLAAVQLGPYLRQLVSDVHRSHGPAAGVEVGVECEELALPADVAAPCGLIVVELLGNAFKYAFPEGSGRVLVVVRKRADARIEVLVSDDGVGLPPEVVVEAPETMGLRLVQMLGRQLGGDLERGSGPGTSLRVAFPEKASATPSG